MCIHHLYLFCPIPYSGKFSHGAKFRVFHRLVGMRENKNYENLNRWSKYDVTVGNAHAQGGARDRRATAALRSRWFFIAIFNLQTPFRTPKDHLKKLTSSTIREANKAVRSVATKQLGKRGSYTKFTPEQQAKVAKYASMALLLHSVFF